MAALSDHPNAAARTFQLISVGASRGRYGVNTMHSVVTEAAAPEPLALSLHFLLYERGIALRRHFRGPLWTIHHV
jgi:hypothetical protein